MMLSSLHIPPDDIIGFLAIAGGLTIALCAVVGGIVAKIIVSGKQERTRREIAAYIAEGSMTPEQGEQLMRAGLKRWER